MRTALSAALVAALLLPGFAHAQSQAQTDAPEITHPWARATAPRQAVGAAYMDLRSPTADALVGASTPAADRAEVHEMQMDGTVMRMREVASLPLPAGQAVHLAPGGYHLMLFGLKQPLQAGQSFPLQLRFQSGRTAQVQVVVERPGGPAAAPTAAQGATAPTMSMPTTGGGHGH